MIVFSDRQFQKQFEPVTQRLLEVMSALGEERQLAKYWLDVCFLHFRAFEYLFLYDIGSGSRAIVII